MTIETRSGEPGVKGQPRRRLLPWAGLIVLFALAWFAWPRSTSLRVFTPEVIGRSEAALWRHYYQHDNLRLGAALWALAREQFGLSPWDSLRVSWHAARAAAAFRSSTNRAQAQAALPPLEAYYAIIRNRSRERFDVQRAAELELEWWQRRREQATPREYGMAIARSSFEVYGRQNPSMVCAALLRAEMMDYRDQRRATGLTDAEWRHVEDGLVEAWQLLKKGLTDPPASPTHHPAEARGGRHPEGQP